jgi:hypothetical protein
MAYANPLDKPEYRWFCPNCKREHSTTKLDIHVGARFGCLPKSKSFGCGKVYTFEQLVGKGKIESKDPPLYTTDEGTIEGTWIALR